MKSLCTPLLGALALLFTACGEEPFASGKERVLILNGKLSSKAAGYALNEQAQDGHWLGSELLVYDPGRKGELRRLGRLDFGPTDVDFDFEQMQAREVATSPTHGVWVLFIDTGREDEWYFGHVQVPDMAGEGQRLPVTLHALRPTDTAGYLLQDITALGFSQDSLLVGTPAAGAFGGQVVRLAGPWPPSFETPENPYYVAADISEKLYDMPGNLGFSGDVAAAAGGVWAVGSRGNALGTQLLLSLGEGGAGPVEEVGSGTQVPTTDVIEGLAAVKDTLFGVSIEGRVYRFDTATGAATLFDDVGPRLPADESRRSTRRLRGAAGVSVP
jgi:hypothetical protein